MCVCKSPGLRPAYLDLVLALGLGVGRDPVESFNLTLIHDAYINIDEALSHITQR